MHITKRKLGTFGVVLSFSLIHLLLICKGIYFDERVWVFEQRGVLAVNKRKVTRKFKTCTQL